MHKLLLNYLTFGCKSEKEFNLVKDHRDHFNHMVWRIVSAVACVYFMVLLLTTFSVDVVRPNTVTYAAMAVMMAFACASFSTFAKPGTAFLMPLVYMTSAALLGFGIMVGVVTSPNFLAATFHVMMICIPLIVVDKPYRMAILEFAMSIVFVVACVFMKTGETRELDIYNVVVFGLLAQFINFYMVGTKMAQFLTARKIELSSYEDDLTGLLNRKAYERDIARLEEAHKPSGVVYAALDVNGLKIANDTIGHDAGDELLKGAAECMEKAFLPYGEVYRIGGDEFVAIITVSASELEEAKREFGRLTAAWKGVLNPKLSVAAGYANWGNHTELAITELAKLADQRMYAKKSEYYINSGIDRRHTRV